MDCHMKIQLLAFKGESPIVADRLLPEGMASAAVNTDLVSGDLGSFADIGNPFQLAKSAVINTIWLMAGPPPDYWLQWSQGEVAYGSGVDASLGAIPGDASYRTLITGLSGGPRQTNLFFATDPSQQGSSAAGAYPYQMFPLGIAAPATAPTVVGPSVPAGPTTRYEYAQAASVNNAIVLAAGSGYKLGDLLDVQGGMLALAGLPAQVQVNAVTASGAIDTSQAGCIALVQQGFYTAGNGPPATAATSNTTGSGTGATLAVNVVPIQGSHDAPPDGWGFQPYDNGTGSYGHFDVGGNAWTISSGQGDIYLIHSTQVFALKTAASFVFQADVQSADAGGGNWADILLQFAGVYNGNAPFSNVVGPTLALSVADGAFTLFQSVSGSNGGALGGTQVAAAAYAFVGGVTYRVRISAVAAANSSQPGFSVTATVAAVASPGTTLASVSGFVPYGGETLGLGTNHRGNHSDGNDGAFSNVLVAVTDAADQATAESTAYVYTYLTSVGTAPNRIEQESGPSDPSATVTFFIDSTTTPPTMTPVNVTIPPAPSGLDITAYRLYRLVRQADGSEVFELVQELPVGTPMPYADGTLDAALAEPLPSAGWDPPPDNLQGIVALSNGVMAGFFANTLCLSVPNFPFAWPVGNQLATDRPIVAIAAIDTTVLVLTDGHPFTAWGSDPSAYSMSKETANQGCVSKRSAATHKRLGVIYASGNGLCYYRGQGQLDLIRTPQGSPYFSIEQWQALRPESIIGVVHDDRYWFWYDNGTIRGGYVLDLSPGGYGLVALDFHVSAAYVDPASDTLYLVPDSSIYPINGSVVSAPLNVVSQWEGGSGQRPRSWQREDAVLPRPACFGMARVRAADYGDVHLKVWCEYGTACDAQVSDGRPFVLAPVAGIRWSLALGGASTINSVELVEQVEELAP
jgi:hypothetical protein